MLDLNLFKFFLAELISNSKNIVFLRWKESVMVFIPRDNYQYE